MVANGWEYYEKFQRPQELVCLGMEKKGIACDLEIALKASSELQTQITGYKQQLPEGINWNSAPQVARWLYDENKLPIPPIIGGLKNPKANRKKERSTSAMALQVCAATTKSKELQDQIETLMALKKVTKRKQYLDKLAAERKDDGRIHPGFTAGTETGRLVSSKPNAQQWDNEVRKPFTGNLVVFDYSGLEYRILAHIAYKTTGDRSMIDEIEADIDPHGAACVRLGWVDCPAEEVRAKYKDVRENVKSVVYGLSYGATEYSLGVKLKDSDGNYLGTERTREFLADYFGQAPGIAGALEYLRAYARKHGYVRSLLNRPRYLPGIRSRNKWARQAAERKAQNVIQNCAADIVTVAMLRCNTYRWSPNQHWFNEKLADLGCSMVLQLHDELVFEVAEGNEHEAAKEIKYQMENVLEGIREFTAPLGVEGGPVRSWGDGH